MMFGKWAKQNYSNMPEEKNRFFFKTKKIIRSKTNNIILLKHYSY